MTDEQLVSAAWFTSTQLKRAGMAGCEDNITSGKADGAYGMNAIEKMAGMDRAAAKTYAAALLRVRPELARRDES